MKRAAAIAHTSPAAVTNFCEAFPALTGMDLDSLRHTCTVPRWSFEKTRGHKSRRGSTVSSSFLIMCLLK